MIMVWNKKEVFVGNSLQRFDEVRNKLSSNGINYDYKIFDSTSPSYFGTSRRARMGTYGVNMDYIKTYYIYVHKKEYDMAQAALRD